MERPDINYPKKYCNSIRHRIYYTINIKRRECYKTDEMKSITIFKKSPKCLLTIDELGPFELDLQRMIRNIEFRPIRNKFISKLSKGTKSIKKTKALLINSDKSTNICKMSKEDYQKHLRNNIAKTHKKSNTNRVNDINLAAKKNCAEVRNR